VFKAVYICEVKTGKMDIEKLKKTIRNIPDFPVKGIQFKDVTTLFKDAEILHELSDGLCEMYKDKGITKVAGIESRGFIMGPLLALKLNAGFVPIRKPGKLPAEVYEESYKKEYGTDAIQIHKDAIGSEDIVLLHDDLLATGGTMVAAVKLIQKFNPVRIYVNFLIELESLKGRGQFNSDIRMDSMIRFD
jgi:adenine phosphoribosyltransferase